MAARQRAGAAERQPGGQSPRRGRHEPRRRPWRTVALLALAALAGSVLWAGSYALTMRAQVAALPVLVRARLRTDGGGPYVPYDRLPPFLVDALVATEDRTFWTNPGLSFEGIARAALVDLEHGAFLQGASTIQQQLARDMFLTPRKTIPRKLEGSILALMITRDFPRPEILAMYLNEVYLGNGATGIARAAQTYFGVAPDRLTPAQSALIAGLPQAPSAYDPLVHYAAAKARQAVVLESMASVGYITAAHAQALMRAPLDLVRRPA